MKVKGFCNDKSFLLLLVTCLFLLLGTYKTGIAGINGFDSISADRTSKNTSIINTTMKVPFHHSTPTLSPVPTPTPFPAASPSITTAPKPTPTPTLSPGECSIYALVKDEDELPLENVSVCLAGPNGYYECTKTDEDGFYTFEELADGDYTLTYEKEGYITQTKKISFEEGETQDFGTTIMSLMGSIYGHVVNIGGEPIHIRICLSGNGLVKKCKYPDEDGYFEFTGLEAGNYLISVKVKRRRYRPSQKVVKLEEGEQKEFEIVLKRKR